MVNEIIELSDRKLDALVAEKVLGLVTMWWTNHPECDPKVSTDKGEWIQLPAYSTTGDGMLDVIHKMSEDDYWLDISSVVPNSDPIVFEVKFIRRKSIGYACEFTLPRAVSMAALNAKENDHERDLS